MISLRFCSVCGAANESVQTHCFACGNALATDQDTLEAPIRTLLHGRYRLNAMLGSGGFSAVYRAQDMQADGCEVALKQITLRGLGADEIIKATDTFNREVALLSTLYHPQVLCIFDHFNDRDHWYLVLEYITGQTLETYLEMGARQNQLPQIDEALDMAQQLCTVLDYLHTRQSPIIFRDLKPGNIMRTPAGKLYLIDFGIARHFRLGQARDTQPLGSPGYAAPEQYGRAQTTPQTDIYSLGVLLFALLSGQDPTNQLLDLATLRLDHVVEGARLIELMQCMLARDPNERPTSIRKVAETLAVIQQRQADQNKARIWLPAAFREYSSASGSQQHMQVQLPALITASMPIRRINRRSVLIGALAAGAAVGGLIWWQRGLTWWRSFGYPYTYKGHNEAVSGVAWSPNSARLASTSQDTTLQIWNPTDENDVLILQGLASGVNGVSWSPDGKRIVAAYGNTVVQIWDAVKGKTLIAYDGHGKAVNGVAWSPNDTFIASCSDDATAQVWNPIDGRTSFNYREHADAVLGVAWSPDSTRVASASADHTVQVWNATDGSRIALYCEHTGPVNAVAWSPDGLLIASASDDHTVHLWRATSGDPVYIYRGHKDVVHSVAWSPNGTRITSGSFDKTARVWNTHDGSHVFIYHGHTGLIHAVAWSPNGAFVASASSDETVQVWPA